jgi:hypothetical protein
MLWGLALTDQHTKMVLQIAFGFAENLTICFTIQNPKSDSVVSFTPLSQNSAVSLKLSEMM